MDKIIKIILIICGTISLILGIIGIFVPLLPAVPFLLITSACYLKGSKKLYNMLIENKYIAQHLLNYKAADDIGNTSEFFKI